MVEGAGNALKTGASVSSTIMICDKVELFPQLSVAVQVRVTVYSPAHAPGTVWSANTRTKLLPHPSLAVAVSNTGVCGQ